MPYEHILDSALGLYGKCIGTSLVEFKQHAFQIAEGVVGFESAAWISAEARSEQLASHVAYRQPNELMIHLNQRLNARNEPLTVSAAAHPDRTINSSDLSLPSSFLAQPALSTRYNIVHELVTCHLNPSTGIRNTVSFFRSDINKPFLEHDRYVIQLLVPHMVQAMRLNFFAMLRESDALPFAVCDARGRLFEVSDKFVEIASGSVLDASQARVEIPFASLHEGSTHRWVSGKTRYGQAVSGSLHYCARTTERYQYALSPANGSRADACQWEAVQTYCRFALDLRVDGNQTRQRDSQAPRHFQSRRAYSGDPAESQKESDLSCPIDVHSARIGQVSGEPIGSVVPSKAPFRWGLTT